MARFFCADLHLDHRRILQYTPRPWPTVEEMNEGIVENFNSVLSKRDELWILGDFAFNNHNKWIMRIRGAKKIILGSHDSCSLDVLKNFSEVHLTKTIKLKNGRLAFLQHTCCRIWERSHYGSIHLFGHSHGRLTTFNLSFDAGIDSNDFSRKYFPIAEDEIIQKVAKREALMDEAGRIVKENGKTLYRQDDISYILNKYSVPVL